MDMPTIKISQKLQKELAKRKICNKETYEEVIWDLIEDTEELSEETKKDIAEALEDLKKGRVYTNEQVKKMLGL